MHSDSSDPRFHLPCSRCGGRMAFRLSVAISKDRQHRAYQCGACHHVVSITVQDGPTLGRQKASQSVDKSDPRPTFARFTAGQ
jgi:hypothetical protein